MTEKRDYKNTLNLPDTDFAMKANLPTREPEQLAKWDAINVYQTLRNMRQGREKFILHDGPPYANGDIHIGHALNKILKDIIVKSKTLSGFDCPYVPGWDCHGLPIELNVEKQVGRPGEKISVEEFRKTCREYATGQYQKQRNEFIRLGVLGDWQNPYLTMDFAFEADVIRSLAKIMENGHVHQGYRPVHWCMTCQSSLAEAEVEYKQKTSPAIDVRFTAIDLDEIAQRFPQLPQSLQTQLSLVIWTTTPWTLPANQGVSVHPDLSYALVKWQENGKVVVDIMLEDLVSQVMQRWNVEHYEIIGSILGAELEGLRLQHPWQDRIVNVLLGEHVTVDAGTGCVHTAPAHGQDDYYVGMKYHLPVDHNVDGNGCFAKTLPIIGGQYIFKADPVIIEMLRENHKLVHAAQLQHSYPHCWRHKTPVIFRATPQWFIGMEQNGLRAMALDIIEKNEWTPAWGKARIYGMIENRPDWCISRQRVWCTPIPCFIHKHTGKLHPDTIKIMHDVANRVEQNGLEVWYALDAKTLLGSEAEDYDKITDGLDVWFDAGVTHAAVLAKRPELQCPADVYLEGSDQHRGWFQSSLLTSVAMTERAPYKHVITHGFTVDSEGHKMSKSIGNTIAPQKVIEKLGADVLRLWVAATDYRGELAVSDEILTRCSEGYRRIRNTARFLLSNLKDFDPKRDCVPFDDMIALDRWAILHTQELQTSIRADYDAYQFHLLYQKIYRFCSIELGSFYLDVLKDRLYTAKAGTIAVRSAQTAIYHILEAFVLWLTPILSFTAEEIWQYIPGERLPSVLLAQWYEGFPVQQEANGFDETFWQTVRAVRDEVNKVIESMRSRSELGSALEAKVILYADEDLYKVLSQLKDELKFVLITSQASVEKLSAGLNAVATEMPNLKVVITKLDAQKCARCWHRTPEIGHDAQHPDICDRCIDNIEGNGEVRAYA